MRLQSKCPPYPADGRAAQPRGFRQFACAPVRLSARRAFQCLNDDLFDLFITDFTWTTRSRLIIEPIHTRLQEPRAPLAHHTQRAAQVLCSGFVAKPTDTRQAPPRPRSQ